MILAAVLAIAAAGPPLDFYKGGDDGLTNRLFDQMLDGDWSLCGDACFVVRLDTVQPNDNGGFRYRIYIGPRNADVDAPPVKTLKGLCREDDMPACGVRVRREIATAISEIDR